MFKGSVPYSVKSPILRPYLIMKGSVSLEQPHVRAGLF